MARTRKREIGEKFTSSLFMVSAKETERQILLSEDSEECSYYYIGESIEYNDKRFCIIDLLYDEETVTIEDEEFPLNIVVMHFSKFLSEVNGNKTFKGYTEKRDIPTVLEPVSYDGAEFSLNGKTYRVQNIIENAVKAIDVMLKDVFGITALHTFRLSDVQHLLVPVQSGALDVEKETSISDDVKQVEEVLEENENPTSIMDFITFQSDEEISSFDSTEDKTIINYIYPSTESSYRTKNIRIADNIEAINLLKKLNSENRKATAEEQSVLVKFSGWGGLNEVFEEKNEHYNDLINILSEEEYSAASSSLLDAFYTPLFVAKNVYDMLQRCGFNGGRVLEPSMGIGHFFGTMPEEMQKNSTLYGVELDNCSAAIAEQLYQNAIIKNTGFENVNFGDNMFDLVISNVPFGEYQVSDNRYNSLELSIHDYFICKMIDCVRPNGLVVALTSSFTMDKKTCKARKYMAQRADLLCAVRFPVELFKDAHTKPVTDLLIFKKREKPLSEDEIANVFWIDTTELCVENEKYKATTNLNDYFVTNPNMILGAYEAVSGPYGDKAIVQNSYEDVVYALPKVLSSIEFKYQPITRENDNNASEIPLPDELFDLPNYSFTIYQDDIWYRENEKLNKYIPKKGKEGKKEKRIRDLIPLRDKLIYLMNLMVNNASEYEIKKAQEKLSYMYDTFVHKYDRICSVGNSLAFSEDSKYPLLCSLEVYDEKGNFISKADIFNKITIKVDSQPVAENSEDALQVSIAEKGIIDFEYMQRLTGISQDKIRDELVSKEFIFKLPNPVNGKEYETADTYLSGYVKEKLKEAELAATFDKEFIKNVEALKKVQPEDIPYNEIFVQLGSTWIDTQIYEAFMYDLLETPVFLRHKCKIIYMCDKFYVTTKNIGGVKAETVYGTADKTGYELLEDCLNMVNSKVYDYIDVGEGKTKAVVNQNKTQAVQYKQDMIKEKFCDWLWNDFERRNYLVRKYNDEMNVMVERKYDGSKIRFIGMNPNISLMEHQRNAVARILHNGNTLLAHVVGAGKTFTMVAAAMEKKRLGLCNKSLFVVPNHLVVQWASEFLRLYPFANVLITTKKDFNKFSRKKFCSRIATGNYDAVIISHEQFKSLPLSKERITKEYQKKIYEIDESLRAVNYDFDKADFSLKSYTKRQLEMAKKQTMKSFERLLAMHKKDDCIDFEKLGIDSLFVDEAHEFKNLAVVTKLRNIAGLTNANSQKASDLLLKCNYLNDVTNYKGVVFATGTPISNAVCELYVMQKYLQDKDLKYHNICTFDGWISKFAETETKVEVKPEGTGYRTIQRVCKYHNLPELMKIFRNVADIRVAEQVKLNVPDRKDHNIAVNPSEIQEEIVKSFAKRAEKIRTNSIDSQFDNMLCVTNDGRKLAIDQRLFDNSLEDDKTSKLNRCIRTVYRIWKLYKATKAAQIIFCDLGTPKAQAETDNYFDVYNDIKSKLISYGVPENEIAFIHDAKTDEAKMKLFDKVNSGSVRVLLGSTQKLGAGTNVQERLIAIHNLDCPWKSSDLQQREGRIIRPKNMFSKAHVYSYVTKNTFDTYLYQTVLNKAQFIAQIMSSKAPSRDMVDTDTSCLNYAEIKALSTGNPAIKEKMTLEETVARLKVARASYTSSRFELERDIKVRLPKEISTEEAKLAALKTDAEALCNYPLDAESHFAEMEINGNVFYVANKKEAAEELQNAIKRIKLEDPVHIGSYRGFKMEVYYNSFRASKVMNLVSNSSKYMYPLELGFDGLGNIARINNLIAKIPGGVKEVTGTLNSLRKELQLSIEEIDKPFEREEEYQEALHRLKELERKLSVQGAAGVENIE